MSSRYSAKRSAAAASGQKNGFRPTSSQSQRVRSILSFPIWTSAPRTTTPGVTLRAIAPAATGAAAIVADPILCVIGVVRMAGAVLVLDLPVVLRPLIDIVDEDPDRRSGG